MADICTKEECEKNAYHKDKCILHCEKTEDVLSDRGIDEACKFFHALLEYITEKCLKKTLENRISLSNSKQFNSSEELKTYINEQLLWHKEENQEGLIKIINRSTLSGIHIPDVNDFNQTQNYGHILKLIENITFKRCTFYGSSIGLLNGGITFVDCTFLNIWQLENYKSHTNIDVIYYNCFFHKIVCNSPSCNTLSSSQFNPSCIFNDDIDFTNLLITENIFSRSYEGAQGTMKGKFTFTDCIFRSDQEIDLVNAKNASFLLKRCTFEQKFKIRNPEYVEGYKYQQKNKTSLKSLTFDSCQIANNDNSCLRIGFLKDCEFSLKNLKNQSSSELNIGDCHFTTFELTNFRNLGKFKLFNINILDDEDKPSRENPRFSINNTSIGNSDFQSINLTSFSKIFMFDNILSEVNYTNVQWPENIEVDLFQKKPSAENTKKQDSYRTIKNVALNNNDRPQALMFYAKEMEYHYKTTPWSPHFGDKFVLFFNKTTNGFGLYWWLPLLLLLYFSIFFYGLLLISLNINDSINYWKYYWVFLNPVHKLEFIALGNWSGWAYFIDFLFRVIQVLLLYQAIQAFRKFSRPL